MMNRKIYETDVMRLIGRNQFVSQVVRCWIRLEIVPVVIIFIIEKRILRNLGLILTEKRAFLHADEKTPDRSLKSPRQTAIEQSETLTLSRIEPSRGPILSSFGGGVRTLKKSHTPHGIASESRNIIFRIGHCPSHGIRPHVKPRCNNPIFFSDFRCFS